MSELFTDLAYWYPKIQHLVLTPKTEIVQTEIKFMSLLDGVRPAGFDDFIAQIKDAISKIGEYPIFLRTGYTSGKHNWRDCCYLKSPDDLVNNIYNLIEFSELVDMQGLPLNTWVVREMLPTEPIFVYPGFNNMPVVREFRYFVHDGIITHRQPYWPPYVFLSTELLPDDWQDKLQQISILEQDIDLKLSEQTIKVGLALKKSNPFVHIGYWSVDWLQSGKNWYLIDMAQGHSSYIWDANTGIKARK